MKRRILLAAILGGVGALADGPGARAVEAPIIQAPITQAQVMIDNFSFSPAELIVAKGTHITWTNRDDIPHTVTSRDDPRVLKSPALDAEDSFAVTLDTPGAYHYFCMLHPHMQGTVIVR